MADNNRRGAAPFLAFLVGGLLVVAVVIGLAVYGAGFRPAAREVVQMPAASLPRAPSLPNPQPTPIPLPQPVPR
jgi:hypothetical protein